MISRQYIVLLYVVLLSAFGFGAGALFMDARAEYVQLKQTQAASQAKLQALEARLREQERVLKRLRDDPAFVEKEIRKRALYSRPGEVIYRFEN